MKVDYKILLCLLYSIIAVGQPNQVTIDRVSLMPNQPSPYVMRDWKQVAILYDDIVYDANRSGQFLPLIALKSNGTNYPGRTTFGIHSYVGTAYPNNHEAINVLPSLVGASLVGLDKSNQSGQNWVLMAQDFYNKNTGENLYLNNRSTSSGNDWWYDMMPNLFFYQLYELYPNIGGEASNQFSAIADKMLLAVKKMGGSATPWQKPFMTYRAWNFKTMTPKSNGVKEPEAAGVFGWLLYAAYKETGNPSYLKGAEWSIEYLNNLNGNPSYELQLPYGTYVAAKMNAELGTSYDIRKMVNWSFDKGNLRGWGTIVDTWSSIDVSGLVGESESDTDYAFQLNGLHQAAALVPMVRYDKRFARDIAKWVLNLANANRLFYKGYLPASLQDGSDWLDQYDQDRVIGYESIKENYNGYSPFATGDAKKGGWAATNLGIYGTSSIGYLGGLIETTNVDKILKIDLNKTDFYSDESYPSYLFFNSYEEEKEINLNVGGTGVDIYDPLSESFLATSVRGNIGLMIPSLQSIMPIICPAGGTITYDKNKMLVDGVIVDYDQHQVAYNNGPRIKALTPQIDTLKMGEKAVLFATVDYQGRQEDLSYQWTIDGMIYPNFGSILEYETENLGTNKIRLEVSDIHGGLDTANTTIEVDIKSKTYNSGTQAEVISMPNPVIDYLRVVIKDLNIINSINIYDVNGVLLKRQNIDENQIEIPFKTYHEGIYLITYFFDNKVVGSDKIIKL